MDEINRMPLWLFLTSSSTFTADLYDDEFEVEDDDDEDREDEVFFMAFRAGDEEGWYPNLLY